jgi:hypothetical protein
MRLELRGQVRATHPSGIGQRAGRDRAVTGLQAATAGDFKQATIMAERFTAGARHLHHSVVRDALAAGLDWWQLGELLALHPQAAFDAARGRAAARRRHLDRRQTAR